MDEAIGTSSRQGQGSSQTNAGTNNAKSKKKREPRPWALQVLKFEELAGESKSTVSIKKYKFLASYNWVKVNEPTILVPGAPPLWSPPTLPIQIPKDDDQRRIEETKDRVVTPRWSAMFAALRIMQPTYSLVPIFLAVERNSLRKLLDFASGRSGGNWRVAAEIVNETLFLTRWERNQQTFLTGTCMSADKAGYGHSFEDTFLKPENDIEGSCAHHRIVEYEIGGMKWLVRFEADGYLGVPDSVVPEDIAQDKNLADSLSSMKLGAKVDIDVPEVAEGIRLIQKGHLVPDASIIEAKCRGIKGKAAKTMEQCWFSQTNHVFIGRQDQGNIQEIEEINMASAFQDWEKENQGNLRKLVKLIVEIKKIVVKRGRCFVLYDNSVKPRALQFWKSGVRDALNFSDELKERHWG